jgi:hypothetical protein
MTVLRTSWMTATLAFAVALAACGGGGEPHAMDDRQQGMPGMEGGHGGMEGMQMDHGVMQRHAEELDGMTAQVRQHVQQMRGLPPEQQQERMGEHARQVSQMLGLVNRQMREMDHGMGMDDDHMGEMMGMTGEEHRRMMDEMGTLRAEVEQLQVAPVAEVRQRMPAHLDRLEQFTARMERSAEHMRAH